jgi:hypothetical protein
LLQWVVKSSGKKPLNRYGYSLLHKITEKIRFRESHFPEQHYSRFKVLIKWKKNSHNYPLLLPPAATQGKGPKKEPLIRFCTTEQGLPPTPQGAGAALFFLDEGGPA